jgi:hypothetical protein
MLFAHPDWHISIQFPMPDDEPPFDIPEEEESDEEEEEEAVPV